MSYEGTRLFKHFEHVVAVRQVPQFLMLQVDAGAGEGVVGAGEGVVVVGVVGDVLI